MEGIKYAIYQKLFQTRLSNRLVRTKKENGICLYRSP